MQNLPPKKTVSRSSSKEGAPSPRHASDASPPNSARISRSETSPTRQRQIPPGEDSEIGLASPRIDINPLIDGLQQQYHELHGRGITDAGNLVSAVVKMCGVLGCAGGGALMKSFNLPDGIPLSVVYVSVAAALVLYIQSVRQTGQAEAHAKDLKELARKSLETVKDLRKLNIIAGRIEQSERRIEKSEQEILARLSGHIDAGSPRPSWLGYVASGAEQPMQQLNSNSASTLKTAQSGMSRK